LIARVFVVPLEAAIARKLFTNVHVHKKTFFCGMLTFFQSGRKKGSYWESRLDPAT
jgi:hypothetical protein